MRLVCLLLVIASAASVLGCASDPSDSAFTTTREQARLALQEMWDEPKRLPRPLVVDGGFLDPNITTPLAAKFFRSIRRDTTVITISIGTCGSFEDCRGAIIAAV